MKRLRRAVSCALVFNLCLLLSAPAGAQTPVQTKTPPPYMDTRLPLDRRVEDLVSRMTLEEKISQMMNRAAAVERLGVPEYEWWNEALHGVARAGVATVFPQAIGLAATWDAELMHDVADAVSTEARAKHHEFARRGERKRYQGLTFWSPNINIFRDPRWGRGQETYGEDPGLTARLGWPSCAACRGTTRGTSRWSRRRSTSPCTPGRRRRGTRSTRARARRTWRRATCPSSRRRCATAAPRP